MPPTPDHDPLTDEDLPVDLPTKLWVDLATAWAGLGIDALRDAADQFDQEAERHRLLAQLQVAAAWLALADFLRGIAASIEFEQQLLDLANRSNGEPNGETDTEPSDP